MLVLDLAFLSEGMKILIADDHSVVRRGLEQIIATRPGWRIAAEVSNSDDILPALRRELVDLAILDVSFGDGRSGIDILGHIRAEFPTLRCLMLSMHTEGQYAIRCLRAGASGYIQKDSSPEELLAAIDRVASGRTYISEAVAGQLASDVIHGAAAALPHELLSPREFEVFRQIAGGKGSAEIAEILNVSVKTVSSHRAAIMEKTGFRSNADIVAYAIHNGLVETSLP